jgi:hypothetical protein
MWTLTKEIERKLATHEMRCLRKAVSETRRDHVKNEEITRTVVKTPIVKYTERQIEMVLYLMGMNLTCSKSAQDEQTKMN